MQKQPVRKGEAKNVCSSCKNKIDSETLFESFIMNALPHRNMTDLHSQNKILKLTTIGIIQTGGRIKSL